MRLKLTCLLLVLQLCGHSQIIRQSLNAYTNCCKAHYDSIDIENDGIFDITIQGVYGIDNKRFQELPLRPELRLYNHLVDSGLMATNPTYWNARGAGFASTNFLDCTTWSPWTPNTGVKYRIFAWVIGTDSTFGWIKYDFRQVRQYCLDTIFALELAYSAQPNINIAAGQTSLKRTGAPAIEIYPTVSNGQFTIISNSANIEEMFIFNMSGQQLLSFKINPDERKQLNLSTYSRGYYIVRSSASDQSIKVCKL